MTFCIIVLGSSLCAQEKRFDSALTPFFARYCNDCHADGAEEGGLNLDELDRNLDSEAARATWIRIYDRVLTGEMPPKDSDQPSAAHVKIFADLLKQPLVQADEKSKGVVLRRLNRREYQNTLNDIFGTNLKIEDTLPPDGRSHEFDNVGSSLNISMVQMQRYLESIDSVMETAIAETVAKPSPKQIHASYATTRDVSRFLGNQWHKLPDGAIVFYQNYSYPTGMLRETNVRETGRYKIRINGYAHQTDQPITFAVSGTSYARGSERPTFGYFEMPPKTDTGGTAVIELEAWVENGYMIAINPWGLYDEKYEIKNNGVKNYKGPGLAILSVQLEGPLVDEFPSQGHHLLFEGLHRKELEPRNPNDRYKSWYRPAFEIFTESPRKDALPVLRRVATRAFRRPVKDAELEPYLDLFNQQMLADRGFEMSLRTAVAAIFCSPDFLYLREQPGWLTDYAIATRLSYFLTRTTPDTQLLEAAANGELARKPAVLKSHLDRLLADERSERFVNDFTDAWLNLRDIEFTSPDRNLYPEFDPFLQWSMLAESRAFFRELINENLPIETIVDSDFAMLNNRLAEFYGIADVAGPNIRRVKLPENSIRGGFLTQASVLKVSANGTNTSPVVRGVYVAERFLGETPPPPPANINGVEPDIRGATTLRELLDKHRDSDNCRSCHAKIDPPGFALESFDPIGGWREHFRSLGEGERVERIVHGRKVRYKIGQPVDATGELVDGREFAGFSEFKSHLATDEDVLARAFISKLLVFATGRELGFSDRDTIEELVKQSAARGHGVRDMIELVVMNEIFRKK